MGNTWGISGPQFLLLFVVALIAPAVGWSVWSRSSRHVRSNANMVGTYELAYLAAGVDRVTDAAVAALLQRDQLRLDATSRRLTAIGTPPSTLMDFTLWTAARSAGGESLHGLHTRMRATSAMTSLADSLAATGLVVDRQRLRTASRAVTSAYVVIFAIGLLRLIVGATRHRPVGFLVAVLIVGGIIVTIWLVIIRVSLSERRTVAGDRMLSYARHSTTGGIGLVALFGLAMYPDEGMRVMFHPPIESGGT